MEPCEFVTFVSALACVIAKDKSQKEIEILSAPSKKQMFASVVKIKYKFPCILVGREGFEPSYSNENRFTVCRL